MNKNFENQFKPNYVVIPGEILLETIKELDMSQAELAKRTGRPKKTINEIIKGKTAITAETAIQFEKVFGVPANFWTNLERNYQETLARLKEKKELENEIRWLKKIPLKELIKLGWIERSSDKVKQLKEVLKFFSVSSFKQLEKIPLGVKVFFRTSKSYNNNPYALISWLRKGELTARNIDCNSFDKAKFQSNLEKIRNLTQLSFGDFKDKLQKFCAEGGVALVFVPALKGVRASGATWWVSPRKAVIQLSFRYNTDDHFWFSFFHEVGHILLHSKKDFFIEDCDENNKEKEANDFASNFLIPSFEYEKFIKQKEFKKSTIKKFASQIGISPGIVVGRLQHDGYIKHSFCNDLKRKIKI